MNWQTFRRVAATLFLVLCAIVITISLWRYYEVYPRTPDGKVRADVILVAPDVSGLVTHVFVKDNQNVRAGTPLFEIDRQRFQIDADHAHAVLAAKEASLAQAERVARRNQSLGTLVATEDKEQSRATVDEKNAEVRQAKSDVAAAEINLARTIVKASVDGKITNLNLRPGAYATAGKPLFALIDKSSIHIDGYFEETKLWNIHIGDAARVRLMGDRELLNGHVQSIAGGIEDRDRVTGGTLMADVNPTFSWIRLAQRIPVRIALDNIPPDISLILGRTAAVDIEPAKGQNK